MNGDELVDVDFAALLERHRATGAAATVTVAQPPSQFGQVDLTDDDVVTGFHEVAQRPVLGQLRHLRPLGRGARRASRRTATTRRRPSRSSPRRARCARSATTGLWLTVNTPKELRRADDHVTAHPEWLA